MNSKDHNNTSSVTDARLRENVDSLKSEKDSQVFNKMLNDCYKYAIAINAKGEPFPTETLIMSMMLSQHKMIEWLSKRISLTKS